MQPRVETSESPLRASAVAGQNPSVTEMIHEQVRKTATSIFENGIRDLVEEQICTALDQGDHLTPLKLCLLTAINASVVVRVAAFNQNSTVPEAPQCPCPLQFQFK